VELTNHCCYFPLHGQMGVGHCLPNFVTRPASRYDVRYAFHSLKSFEIQSKWFTVRPSKTTCLYLDICTFCGSLRPSSGHKYSLLTKGTIRHKCIHCGLTPEGTIRHKCIHCGHTPKGTMRHKCIHCGRTPKGTMQVG
jgi:hypothetical protein